MLLIMRKELENVSPRKKTSIKKFFMHKRAYQWEGLRKDDISIRFWKKKIGVMDYSIALNW